MGGHGSPSRTSRRRALAVSVGGGGVVAGAALAAVAVPAVYGQETDPAGIVGTWLVTNAAPGSIRNSTLVQFFPRRSLFRTGAAHLSKTPGFGAWTQTGEREYEVTYMTVQVDKEGAFNGHRKTWLKIALDPSGTSWSAQTRGTLIDKDGVQAPIGAPGRNGGVRLVAEPFPADGA